MGDGVAEVGEAGDSGGDHFLFFFEGCCRVSKKVISSILLRFTR